MSATAVSTAFLSALSACAAAPLPRPPAPTRPTLRALVTDWPETMLGNPTAATPAAAPDFLRKSRRSIWLGTFLGVFVMASTGRSKGPGVDTAAGSGKSYPFLNTPADVRSLP